MHGQVPDHVDVLLVEPQVDPRKAEVVQVAQMPRVDQLFHFHDRRAVDEGVAGHQLPVNHLGELDQLPRPGGRVRERLFDEHVFAVMQRLPGNLVVSGNRRGDQHRIHVRIEEILGPAIGLEVRILPRNLFQPAGIEVTNRCEFAPGSLVKHPGEIRTPIPQSDKSRFDHLLSLAVAALSCCSLISFDSTTVSRNFDLS